jgi:hypothetical protein
MKAYNKEWKDNFERIFEQETKFVTNRLQLPEKIVNNLPVFEEFIDYIIKGTMEYFARYDFNDLEYIKHLIRHFICNKIDITRSSLVYDRKGRNDLEFKFDEWSNIMEEAEGKLSLDKEIWNIKMVRATYDVRLLDQAIVLMRSKNIKTREALLLVNKECEYYEIEKLIDQHGGDTQFFVSMIDACRQRRHRK